ncbi:Tat pathway signal protein, partial [Vibrio vulnificus]
DSLFAQAFDQVKSDSITIRDQLSAALESSPEEPHFPDNRLSQQLHTVARLIKSSEQLGHQRQVYFVGMGGYDTHANQLVAHKTLLAELSQSLDAFNTSLENAGIAHQVTTMTMSDFGRRLASNGSGTDHGWASNHWVMGGALQSGRIYGQWPSLVLDGENDFNRGRMIPTTSVEQIGATVAKWMGIQTEQQLLDVFPNLKHFAQKDLGFLAG